MFDNARLRLTIWYLAILTLIVGVLSFALYHVVVRFPPPEVPPGQWTVTKLVALLASIPNHLLAGQIVAVDFGVLILAALGAYVLAGQTLEPIADTMARQRRFAAGASHELRTPLTVLQGSMEVALLRRRSVDEYEQVLRQSIGEVQRMSELVVDLLALARAEYDAEGLKLTRIDFRSVIQAAVDSLQTAALQKGQTLSVTLPDPLPLLGDAVKLRQAISNLVENAVRYTPEGGAISVRARQERGQLYLDVGDTGPGIASQHLPHLFEPFYRVDTAPDQRASHVGLGLALSSWIISAHGGRVTVQSTVDEGTTFTVSLPNTGRRHRLLRATGFRAPWAMATRR